MAKMRTSHSNLDPEVKDLMAVIWDINRMQRTLKELNFDTEKNPLGKLTSEAINKGFKILSEIQKALRGGKE